MIIWKRKKFLLSAFLVFLTIVGIIGVVFYKNTTSSLPSSLTELEARKRCLEKNGITDENVLLSKLSGISYQGDKYPNIFASVANWMDAETEIMAIKKVNVFTTIPQKSSELKAGYDKIIKEKKEFVHLSLIPRKSNGEIDWINYWEKYWTKPLPYSKTEAENYLKNKTNPLLQKWYKNSLRENLGEVTQEEERVFLNERLNEHIQINLNAKVLFEKLGNDKIWAGDWIVLDKFTGGKKVSINLQTNYLVPPPNL